MFQVQDIERPESQGLLIAPSLTLNSNPPCEGTPIRSKGTVLELQNAVRSEKLGASL